MDKVDKILMMIGSDLDAAEQARDIFRKDYTPKGDLVRERYDTIKGIYNQANKIKGEING